MTAPHGETSYSQAAEGATRAFDRLAQLGWCVWAPEHRAWWRADSHGYTEDAITAGAFSLERAVEIWIQSGYNDVPVPRAAAIMLMASLEQYAIGATRRAD